MAVMRDPITWAFPLGRMFGIDVRVHFTLPLLMIGLILKAATAPESAPGLWVDATLVMLILFVSVLLHEFGHCFAARSVDGEASELLLWPLGGLAPADLPHAPRAHFLTALGGPAVSLLLCLAAGGALTFVALLPPFNPFGGAPYRPQLRDWRNGVVRTTYHASSQTAAPADATATDKAKLATPRAADPVFNGTTLTAGGAADKAATAPLTTWQVVAAQTFWINWLLLLLNLLPGFPLDGGRVLQSILWWRGDFRQATSTACYVGFVVMLVLAAFAIMDWNVVCVALAWFVYISCKQQLILLETGGEDVPFGYDFSQGYSSLEGETPPPTRRRRPNVFQRWLQKRAARKAQREVELREVEDRRMDELLEKVQRDGLQSLTDEERRFLTRVSARYRGGKP
jgi:Zn-dependent protease